MEHDRGAGRTDPTAIGASEADHGRLAHFPVSFFAVAMGLCGFALALRASEHALGFGAAEAIRFDHPSWIIGALAAAALAFFLSVYALKLATHRAAVAEEWAHPVRIAFFPAISIGFLLLAAVLAPAAEAVATPLWILGAVLQGALTLSVVSAWISHRPFQHMHLNPAWFIPAVGNVVAPLAGARLGFVEVSWLFFSAGLIFWLVLLTLVMNRLIFHDPLPERMAPTLVILIAPPAVAFLSYLSLGGEIDAFARILLNAGYVFAAVVATQAPKLFRLTFALSWWALSFPVAALAVASLRFGEKAGSAAHEAIGLGLTGLLAVIVAWLVVRTARAALAHEICLPE